MSDIDIFSSKSSKVDTSSKNRYLFEYWLKENNYNSLIDFSGSTWILSRKSEVIPDNIEPKKPVYKINLYYYSEENAEDLVLHKVLKTPGDDRIIKLLENRMYRFVLPEIAIKSDSQEKLRISLANKITAIKRVLLNSGVIEYKRRNLFRLLEEKQFFGERENF